ncbi:MAG: hypothetical protein SCAL_001769 [Candidatus Syntrophoarchaeum caldarius]|uniref:Uncharacterized protein n=1 Tax=Candidatus Syntropharchaeum caldarium TaxID=1838285 RepID=A0A1F2P7J7_9EURY|nr:MAG: hypothetical protein SCAL_001769 [Candidatus Syntrophoarchaeum caldarius]
MLYGSKEIYPLHAKNSTIFIPGPSEILQRRRFMDEEDNRGCL